MKPPQWLLDTRRHFRVATPGSFAWNYTKTMAQTTVLWSIFLIAVPVVISEFEHRVFDLPTLGEHREVAAVLFWLLGGLGLWGGFVMAKVGRGTPLPLDAAPELVIAGPYRYVRNPMAISAPGQAVAVSLWLDSSFVVIYAVGAAIVWHFVIRPPEELDLAERFGADYERYRRHVRCWIPRFPAYDPTC